VNYRQAKTYALRVLAQETEHHVDNGSEWLRGAGSGPDWSETDEARVVKAVLEIADGLRKRAERLAKKEALRDRT
jgi:acyl-CoA reductase-like NAD-dependent aldehyde dehydrogenase